MAEPTFDASEVIAGYPLTVIRRAISWVGLMDDRDDVKTVADSLECSEEQATRVLRTLEHRGFVTPTKHARRWETTDLASDLRYRWRPARRVEPATQRDDDDEGVYSQMFEEVPCSILRIGPDDDHSFEEGDLVPGVCVDYESSRIIEINISEPDDYDDRHNAARIDRTVYIGLEEARKFVASMQEAIAHAENELARRVLADQARPKRRRKTRAENEEATRLRAEAKAKNDAARAEEKRRLERERTLRDEREDLEETLIELGFDARMAGNAPRDS